MKFAGNLTFMFRECPTLTGRYMLAKQAGFKAVESAFPIGYSIEEVADARRKAGVEQVFMNIFTGDIFKSEVGWAAIPGSEDEFRKSVDFTIPYARALDCKMVHVMSGNVASPTELNDSTYEKNIRYAVDKFRAQDIVALIEPINLVTRPNYYMCNVEKAFELVKKINSPYLKVMLDIFHLQYARGNITGILKEYLPYIGHVQVAQVPERNEPDSAGEIDYRYVFSLLEKLGYNDYVGLEYWPRAETVKGLKWITDFGYAL